MNLTWNDKEKLLQKKLREEVEIPEIVTEKTQKAFTMIKNGRIVQTKAPKAPYGWMKTTMKAAGCTAAVLGVGFIVCVTNPVMAKNLPLVGGIFAELQDKVSFFGEFADKAIPLTSEADGGNAGVGNAEADGSNADISNTEADNSAAHAGNDTTGSSTDSGKNSTDADGSSNAAGTADSDGDSVYTKTSDGLTITFSEVYANEQAIYLTMKAESEEPFPETMLDTNNELGIERPVISTIFTKNYSFMNNGQSEVDAQYDLANPEGVFLDDHTYTCILRIDLKNDTLDRTEYNQKYDELTQEIITSLGLTEEEFHNLDAYSEEGDALLSKFNDEILSQSGSLKSYIKQIPIPEDFTLKLNFEEFLGKKKNPETWDSGYTDEELAAMTDEEWREVMNQMPEEYSKHPNEHEHYWFNGPWNFEIPIHVDTSQTVVQEINETNENGIGLKSVVKTPYELTVYDMYEEGADSDTFLVALDANGNKLPYNESNADCDNFTIQDRDISTVDIYILDYMQYMDELKGEERYNNNENKPEEEKWSTLLEANAKYHKTLHF
ncbi:DUF4179 domain-containing protein [Blautia schinkii]|nr:DUF4179 domain-containing protein [Blautia schinkii]